MLVKTVKVQSVDQLGKRHWHDVHTVQCDTCGKRWETRVSKAKLSYSKTHACSVGCKRIAHSPGGVADELKRVTNLERFGAENPFAAEVCKQKTRLTWYEKYGIEHGPSAPEVRAKAHQTSVERYGEHPIASEAIQTKTKQTMLVRHGVERPMQLVRVRQAMQSGSIAKNGTPYPMQNPETMQVALDKRYATIQAKGGKAYQSKPEREFGDMLRERFGADDIKVQQRLTRKWSIDFYIKSIDTYVSFDGVYWHGLDKPIEVIRTSLKPRDQTIYEKWLKDRELEAYVIEHGLRLVRITDQEFKTDPQACLLRIVGKSNGPSLPDSPRTQLHL